MAGTRPNDFPCMDLGEIRNFEFDYSGGAGPNSLVTVAFSCVPSSGVTFEDEAGEGLLATATATAAQVGCYTIICTGELTSGETIKLKARLKISDPTQTQSGSDYDD